MLQYFWHGRVDHKKGKGRCRFYIHNNLNYKLRRDICAEGIESMFIEITVDTYKHKIVGILYRPPNNAADHVFLDRLHTEKLGYNPMQHRLHPIGFKVVPQT